MGMETINSLISNRIVKYAFIGALSTLIHIGISALFIFAISDSLLLSNISGFLVAYIFSYLMQSIHVFGHSIDFKKAFKYFVVQFGSLMTSILISHLFTGYNNYIKTILVVVFMPLVTFVIHKFWTFKEED